MPTQLTSDIIRDGFVEQGHTYTAEELAQLYREHDFDNWREYILTVFHDGLPQLWQEITGRGRSGAEAVAWFHQHYRLDEVDYVIFRKETRYTQLESNLEAADD